MALELRKAGWKKAVALTGGWDAWVKAGFAVEQAPGGGVVV